ncbi:PEP-CTERM sorting domain-containing protein [Alteromonas oceanisediminis]|uniref:PEP-CTERM sorting domain-containing protein n=1 Tax=Alteromonas oceanisediminis TaxID=2836180 RepID=UPI001BDAAC78|nr:PEP-CTERM sorting domain-containing protein [Alteromonas oceanisediminis]MBT0585628.1 PEP-CTERM sorting domain-containing protein [Alteromonas oceanisediminis]
MLLRVLLLAVSAFAMNANANLILTNSPTSAGALPGDIPKFGGAVIDIITADNQRLVNYISRDDLFHGHVNSERLDFASQQLGALSFSSSMLDAIGSGIAELAIRLSLYDGDNAVGADVVAKEEYQAGKNFLEVNGVEFGNFSDVETLTSSRKGEEYFEDFKATGFANKKSATGWFYSNNSSVLGLIQSSVISSSVLGLDFVIRNARSENWISFHERDASPQPQVQPPGVVNVSEPSTIGIMLAAVALLLFRKRVGLIK